MAEDLILPLDERYTDYLSDESGLQGRAESISFPQSEEDVVAVVRRMKEEGKNITIQGGKTGILGGSVPSGGHLMNLSRFKEVKEFSTEGGYFLTVEPGVSLEELKAATDRLKIDVPLYWPPDPTEKTASVGGVVSCGSAGCTAGYYGRTAEYVEAVRVVDAEGTVHEGPADTYLSREGILGVITEITLRLIEKPKEVWGIGFFFPSDEDALRFAEGLQERYYQVSAGTEEPAGASPGTEEALVEEAPAAMEYLDRATLDLVEERKEFLSAIKDLPGVPEGTAAMVYLEIHGASDADIEAVVEPVMELAAECGSDPEEAWAVSGPDIEKLRAFRHAAAESVNLKIGEARRNCPEITKLGTDMSVPGIPFARLVTGYRDAMVAAGLEGVIFGHIAGNHLHVNLLPESREQYEAGKVMLRKWAAECRDAGGSIITEHGVGKLKVSLFAEYGDRGRLEELRRLKNDLDPEGLWNPGTVIL